MDLEKEYETIDQHGCRRCYLRGCGVGGKLLKAVQSLHVDSRACDGVGKDVSERLPDNAGSRHGCVMSPYGCLMYIWML